MEISIGHIEVKSTNIFQLKPLYVQLHEWCIENAYSILGDTNFPETYYWEARSQTGGSEYWIWWRPVKVIEDSEFWRRKIDIVFHGVGIKQVEIMYKGQKVKADKGKVELILDGKLEFDIEQKMQKNALLAPFFELFWKRMYRREIEMWRKEVMTDMKTIQDVGRQFLQLGTLGVPRDPFMAPRGYEDPNF